MRCPPTSSCGFPACVYVFHKNGAKVVHLYNFTDRANIYLLMYQTVYKI